MKRWMVALALLLVVAVVAAGGWWFLGGHPEWWFWFTGEFEQALAELGLEGGEEPEGLMVSGFIEADEASVATELGGRIVAIAVDEGDEVAAGTTLVVLDDSLLLSQIEVAEAELAVAEASLAQIKAGVRQETLDHALALVEQSKAAQHAARVAWDDAQAMLEDPQELELALTAARAQLGTLDFQQRQAQALANAAQAGRDFAEESLGLLEGFEPRQEWVMVGQFGFDNLPEEIPLPPLPGDGEYLIGDYKIVISGAVITVYYRATIRIPAHMLDEARHQQALATYQSWAAWTGLAQAQAAQRGAQSYAGALERHRANPIALQAQANAAESQHDIATAMVRLAEAQAEGLEMGATPEQIAAVEAQVEIARAALGALEVQKDQFTLEAPISGMVLERPIRVGEVALPGGPLLTLADLDTVTLTVYVPEDQLGRVQLGQHVSVRVDAYPERTFEGMLVFISGEAEFTPRNVQTREERTNMVFAVKVKLSNGDHALKPGMPADAVLADVE